MTTYLVCFVNRYGFRVSLRFWSAIPAQAEVERLRGCGYEARSIVLTGEPTA